MLHTRLRTKCSSLNYEIYLKNLTESPLCRCGSIENSEHYFFYCHYYRNQRNELLQSLTQICQVSVDVLLYGDNSLSIDTNTRIFQIVQKYIKDTKRF